MTTYEIKPRPYIPPQIVPVTASDRDQAAKKARADFGCGITFAAGVLFVIGLATMGFIPSVIAVCALLVVYYLARREAETNRVAEQRVQAERKQVEAKEAAIRSEASSLTSTLLTLHEAAPKHIQTLEGRIKYLDTLLYLAEADFRDSAFAPFWDHIERAANELASFSTTAQQLTYQAQQYYKSLNEREHTFPRFPVVPSALPDPTEATKRMAAIIRKAQCNFQFATIYEQRKTNNILKEGFMSLSSAISDLGYTVSGSINQLRASMSSDIARLVDEQIATRESIDSATQAAQAISKEILTETRGGNEVVSTRAEQQRKHETDAEKMLDNIQRRRKPFPHKSGDGAY